MIICFHFLIKAVSKYGWMSFNKKIIFNPIFIRYLIIMKPLNDEFIKRYWRYVLSQFKLDENFIERYYQYLDVDTLYYTQSLSVDFIEKHITTKTPWRLISQYQKLNSDFIQKYIYCLHIYEICCFQKLDNKTINFIINHKDSRMRLLGKKLIPQFQQLTLSQIIRFKKELDYSLIRENNKILCYYDNKRI